MCSRLETYNWVQKLNSWLKYGHTTTVFSKWWWYLKIFDSQRQFYPVLYMLKWSHYQKSLDSLIKTTIEPLLCMCYHFIDLDFTFNSATEQPPITVNSSNSHCETTTLFIELFLVSSTAMLGWWNIWNAIVSFSRSHSWYAVSVQETW